jgi:hypothetical protein
MRHCWLFVAERSASGRSPSHPRTAPRSSPVWPRLPTDRRADAPPWSDSRVRAVLLDPRQAQPQISVSENTPNSTQRIGSPVRKGRPDRAQRPPAGGGLVVVTPTSWRTSSPEPCCKRASKCARRSKRPPTPIAVASADQTDDTRAFIGGQPAVNAIRGAPPQQTLLGAPVGAVPVGNLQNCRTPLAHVRSPMVVSTLRQCLSLLCGQHNGSSLSHLVPFLTI